MKKLYVVAFVLLIISSFSFTSKVQEKSNKLTATFLGLTDDQYYKFVDSNKNEFLFYEYNEDTDVILEDDENINKKFALIWQEKEIKLVDEDDNFTGETLKVKTITSIKLLN